MKILNIILKRVSMNIENPMPIKIRPHSGLGLPHPLSSTVVSPLCSRPSGNLEDPLPSLANDFVPLPVLWQVSLSTNWNTQRSLGIQDLKGTEKSWPSA